MINILDYMKSREWKKQRFDELERYCLNIARRDRNENNIPSMIGSLLIYHQLIEYEMKKIIELNLQLIKVKIYPSTLFINISLDNLTFGKIVLEFKKYLVDYEQENDLIENIKTFNIKRNNIVHKLFNDQFVEVKNIEKEMKNAELIISSLFNLHNKVCSKLDNEAIKLENS